MSRVDDYRAELRRLPEHDWIGFLDEHSGLPGPRGNLELLHAVVEEGGAVMLRHLAASEDEFRSACGAAGLGRLLAEGDPEAEADLHALAGDQRWRVREGVAMALQRYGDADLPSMLEVAERWAEDESALVRRSAVAAVCEPRLLRDADVVRRVVVMLDSVTAGIARVPAEERRSEPYRVLRRALGYGWSVAIAAAPAPGLEVFDGWAETSDRDVQWVVRENRKKARMRKAMQQVGKA
jgi:hypothetical protein